MRISTSRSLVLALLAIAAMALFACSGDDSDGEVTTTQEDFAPLTEAPGDSRTGGTLTVLAGDGAGVLDPGVVYHQFGYMVSFPTQRTLLAWEPDQSDQPVPDLAASEPDISEDGQEVTFEIREGVHFSPPVDREIVADDFKYAIERGLMPGVANGYVSVYLGDLEGFDAAVEQVEQDPSEAPDIAGIEALDERTLRLSFEQPVGLTAVQALSLPLGAPVPRDYAAEFDAEEPSAYEQNLVATGPYMVENDADGSVTGYVPGERIDLVRNPNWDSETDFRPAYLDSIEIRLGFDDPGATTRRITNGESSVSGDITLDPDALRTAATEHPDLLSMAPIGATRYVTLNTRLEPFDDINVRRAVAAATDREAMRLALGGENVGDIATHFIPPEVPGFEQAGGHEGTAEFLEQPGGDMELAEEYMRQAGFESGRYEGDVEIEMVGMEGAVERRIGEIMLETLEQLGFEVDYQAVSADAMYTRFCTVPEMDIAICPNISWIKDFNDAQTILEPTFSGEAIQPTNNTNISELDVPEINSAMEEAKLATDADRRAELWGEVDSMVTEQAPAIPWVWDFEPVVASEDVVNVVNSFTGKTDLSFASLRSP